MYFLYDLGFVDYEGRGKNNLMQVECLLEDGKFVATGFIFDHFGEKILNSGQILNEILSYFPDDEILNRIVAVSRDRNVHSADRGSSNGPLPKSVVEEIVSIGVDVLKKKK